MMKNNDFNLWNARSLLLELATIAILVMAGSLIGIVIGLAVRWPS